MLMRFFLFWLTARLPGKLIHRCGARYLERYFVGRLFGFEFLLHRFVAGDHDEDLHDHPWRLSISLILAGHYLEERLRWYDCDRAVTRTRRVRFLNVLTARSFHRIAEISPETWTLFIHRTHREKGWGFLEPVGTSDGLVYRPYPETRIDYWERTAPSGRDLARAPLPRKGMSHHD